MKDIHLGLGFLIVMIVVPGTSYAAGAESSWQAEWNRLVEGGKQEGKVVVGIAAAPQLRTALEKGFGGRFKEVQLEAVTGGGSQLANRIASEFQAGLQSFDVLIGGPGSQFQIASMGATEPIEPSMMLPEVRDPRQWWGGHIWADNQSTRRFVYSFQAYMPILIYYHSDSVKPAEIRSYDDLLKPKWKEKIGFLDPRNPGGGWAIWAYLRMAKGEAFLKKLSEQDLLLSSNQRQLSDFLAKGRIQLTLGLSYYQLASFIDAGLPVRPLPIPVEGVNATSGNGTLTLLKNSPNPRAGRVFANWLLSKEGQEIFGKAMGQPTRRLDIDTKWMESLGVYAAKDSLTLEEYHARQIDLEDKFTTIREPATELARRLLK